MKADLNNGGEGRQTLPEENKNNAESGKSRNDLPDGSSLKAPSPSEGGDCGKDAQGDLSPSCGLDGQTVRGSFKEGAEKRGADSADDFFADLDAPLPPAQNGQTENGGEGKGGKSGKKFVLWRKPAPEPKRKYSPAFIVALSGISCAVAVVALTLGILSSVLVATGYIVAQIALMVPLSKRFYLGGFLAYVGTVLLSVVFGALTQFWNVVPFAMFFGLHPLANAFQLKYSVNKWLAVPVKMAWFDATLYVMYLVVFNGVLGASHGDSAFFTFVNDYIWLVIIVFGSLLFLAYDYVMTRAQRWINVLVNKIKK